LKGGIVNRKNDRKRSTQFDRARDELFSHIHRCGVLQASEEHQVEWMDDTISYLGERYPELVEEDLTDLRQIGVRFCRPVIQRVEEPADESGVGEDEGVASEVAA
jgi:hypothetical protein